MVDKRQNSDKSGEAQRAAPVGGLAGIFGSFNPFGMQWPLPGAGQPGPSSPLGAVPDFSAMAQAFSQMFGGAGLPGLPKMPAMPTMPNLAQIPNMPALNGEIGRAHV